MLVTLPLKDMTIEDKIQTMEIIWEDLCKKAESLKSPEWHYEILKKRERMVKEGDDEYIDWEDAKKQIRDKIS